MKKRLIIILVLLLLLSAGGVAGFLYYQSQQETEAKAQRIQTIASNANDIVAEIQTTLRSNAPITRVYDSDDNLVMTLKLTKAVQTVTAIPEQLAQAVRNSCSAGVVQTVVDDFFSRAERSAGDEEVEGYRIRVGSEFTEADLIRYLAVSSSFGTECVGVVDACYTYFGLSLENLNTVQLDFLGFCFRNQQAKIDDFLTQRNISADRLGVNAMDNSLLSLRSMVIDSLERIEGVDLLSQSYAVKLTVSYAQQSVYQALVDKGMRELIELNMQGGYAQDMSVAIVDRSSGFLRAFISARTSATKEAVQFTLSDTTFLANIQQLKQLLKLPHTFGFTLQEVVKQNGDKELKTIRDMFDTGELAKLDGSANINPLDVLNSLYTGNTAFNEITLVYQVIGPDSTTVYSNKGAGSLKFDNPRVPEFFSLDDENNTSYGFKFDTTGGCISLKSTNSYDIAVVAGTTAMGGSINSKQRSVIESTISDLQTMVAVNSPQPTPWLWQVEELDLEKKNAFDANFSLITRHFDKKLEKLDAQTITSVESRKKFEDDYAELDIFIATYESSIGEVYAGSLRDRLSAVRIKNKDQLIAYSV